MHDLVSLYNLKNAKNTNVEVVLLFVKLQASVFNVTKSNTPTWVLFTFFILYKWYHIAQHVTNILEETEQGYVEIILQSTL